MNYLAHAYLSFNEPDILVGNIISDYVKGKKKFDYTVEIQKGIALHRFIDEFTDTHSVTHAAKQFFRKDYRLYAGAFVDVVYDHFLAIDTKQFSTSDSLLLFTQQAYSTLQNYQLIFPGRFQKMFPYMRTQNWLFNYQYKWGIEKSFGGLQHRALYIQETETAFKIFNQYYSELKSCYEEFFPDVKNFAINQLRNLLHG